MDSPRFDATLAKRIKVGAQLAKYISSAGICMASTIQHLLMEPASSTLCGRTVSCRQECREVCVHCRHWAEPSTWS